MATSATGGVVAVPVTVSNLTCTPTLLTGPGTSSCSVSLSAAAPSGGLSVALSSNNTAVTVPASLSVPAAATSGSFTATAGTVASTQTVVLSAALNGSSQTASLSLAPPVTVTALSCSPTSLTGRGTSSCSVSLSAAASSGGLSVALSGNNAAVTVPASLSVPAAATSGSFTATAGTVASTQTVVLSAALNGSSQTASLSLAPPVTVTALSCSPTSLTGRGTSSCSVSLSAAAPSGGLSVALNSNKAAVTVPASLSVPAAATSGSFTATASRVASTKTVVLSAALNGSSQTASLSLAPPVTVTALSCSPTSLIGRGTSSCSVSLSAAASSGGLSVALSSNNAAVTVPASLSVPAAATSGSFTATAGRVASIQTVVLTAALNGTSKTASLTLKPRVIQDSNAKATIAKATMAYEAGDRSLTPTASTTCPCSVWDSTAQPILTNDPDTSGIEVGMKFSSNIAGYVLGARFYKGSSNIGTHSAHLWTKGGVLLAATTFMNETSSGWQQVNFNTPVAITANATYVISYWVPSGHYSNDTEYFSASGVDNGPLHALKDGEDGGNGIYTYTQSSFPASRLSANNYWVDIVFNTVLSPTHTAGEASVSGTSGRSTAMILPAAATQRAGVPAVPSTPLRSLDCAPKAVRAGDSFTCEVRLASPGAPDATALAVASNSSDVRLPATIDARADQSSMKFRGTVDAATPQSIISIATRNAGDEAEDRIEVLASRAPVLSLPTTVLVKSGEPLDFRVAAQDPAGLPVRIAASNLPAGASFEASSGRFNWTPAPNQEGTFAAVFSAVNSTGFRSSIESKITVGSGKPVIARSAIVTCSPGGIATLKGSWLSLADEESSDPSGSSRELGGTTVHINGELTAVLYASWTRVDFQCPNTSAEAGLDITVETSAGASSPLHAAMQEATPTLLPARSSNPGQGQITLAGTNHLATTRDSNASGEPAQNGDLVSIHATGLGASVSSSSIRIVVGGVDAQVQSVVPAADAAGVFLINVRIPAAAPLGDAIPVQLEMISPTGRRLFSNTVTLAIE